MTLENAHLVLTSDFPSTRSQAVIDEIASTAPRPRIAWIPPLTADGRRHFPAARQLFESYGFPVLEYCDIDEEPRERQLAELAACDVLYLTGGDPLAFRRNLLGSGLARHVRDLAGAGLLIVGASAGAMQLTRNVSLYRLVTTPLDEVCATRAEYDGLGLVEYEFLPHVNRFEPAFLETVRRYSERISHDIIGVDDGAAVVHRAGDQCRYVGRVVRFRHGTLLPVGGRSA